jgi:hypothetical protein
VAAGSREGRSRRRGIEDYLEFPGFPETTDVARLDITSRASHQLSTDQGPDREPFPERAVRTLTHTAMKVFRCEWTE